MGTKKAKVEGEVAAPKKRASKAKPEAPAAGADEAALPKVDEAAKAAAEEDRLASEAKRRTNAVDDDTSGNVTMIRDPLDEHGSPVEGPMTADVHPSNVQSYLDANVGWHKKGK